MAGPYRTAAPMVTAPVESLTWRRRWHRFKRKLIIALHKPYTREAKERRVFDRGVKQCARGYNVRCPYCRPHYSLALRLWGYDPNKQ